MKLTCAVHLICCVSLSTMNALGHLGVNNLGSSQEYLDAIITVANEREVKSEKDMDGKKTPRDYEERTGKRPEIKEKKDEKKEKRSEEKGWSNPEVNDQYNQLPPGGTNPPEESFKP